MGKVVKFHRLGVRERKLPLDPDLEGGRRSPFQNQLAKVLYIFVLAVLIGLALFSLIPLFS
ncbi:hypothetical protein [Flexibacterium corallicola]|uniref:hypothetical protein n=1 Tax=Flexibacterium corallicola TaxID=3037259 RepID=UPI00286FABD7|nr:hypothetical protein [Pseudovibrio sp. M1P-2-3]